MRHPNEDVAERCETCRTGWLGPTDDDGYRECRMCGVRHPATDRAWLDTIRARVTTARLHPTARALDANGPPRCLP